MKKILLCIVTVIVTGVTSAFCQVKIYNDQRDELSGIVWRLAGAEEFNKNISDTSYKKDIETYFAKFTKHPLMDFIRSMREEPFLIGYNAIPGAADVLKIENGMVKISSDKDVKHFTSIDTRWTVDNLNRYASLLNDFYRKSKFDKFYETHQPVYQRYIDSMKVVIDGIDTKWFETFYGVSLNNFEVISCPSYGIGNYGGETTVGNTKSKNITIGGWYDINMEQKYNIGLKNIILHELNHMFSHSVILPYLDKIRPAAEKIFPYIEDQVTKLGHGEALTVIEESLNQLFAIMYAKDTEGKKIFNDIILANYQGFLWMGRAVRYMDNFYNNRDVYQSIADFMPQLLGFINLTSDNMEALVEDYKRSPRVVSTFPAYGSTVPSTLKEIRIQFSHPMSIGMSHSGDIDSVKSIFKPYDEDDETDNFYWADDYTIVYPVTTVLEKGKHYGIQIHKGFLRRKDTGTIADQKYELIFKVE